MTARCAFQLACFILPIPLLTGCTTAVLWQETGDWDARKVSAQPNHLELFDAPRKKDFLVVYEEVSERTESVHKRAYFLYENESRIEKRDRPQFVSVRRSQGLEPVPVFSSAEAVAPSLARSTYVIASTNDYLFILHSADGEENSHMLPVYSDGIGEAERIALTPFAITVDAALMCGWVFLEAWAHGNWNGQ